MKVIKNEFNFYPLYEIDDLDDFNDGAKLDDFIELDCKKLCIVDELNNLFIIELNKKDKLLKYKEDRDIFLLVSRKKYYLSKWNGKIMNVLESSVDEYGIEILNKIRNNDVIYFTTHF